MKHYPNPKIFLITSVVVLVGLQIAACEKKPPLTPELEVLCSIDPSTLNFGTTTIFTPVTRTVTFENTSEAPIELGFSYTCQEISIEEEANSPLIVGPGQSQIITVTYTPEQSGPLDCAIELTGTSCGPILCTGNPVNNIFLRGISPNFASLSF